MPSCRIFRICLLPQCVITYCAPNGCAIVELFLMYGFSIPRLLELLFYLRTVLFVRLIRLVTCAFVSLVRDACGCD